MCKHCDWEEIVEDVEKLVVDIPDWMANLCVAIIKLEHITPQQREVIDKHIDKENK